MNKENAASKSIMLQDMVTIKKLRFPDSEDGSSSLKPSSDVVQRIANFKEFKAVYSNSFGNKCAKVSRNKPCPLHKTKSGSMYKFSKIKQEPQYVETINIQLPIHYGADRAVHQLFGNKIKPKRSNCKINREIITENIARTLKKIDEEVETSATDIPTKSIAETQVRGDAHYETMWKNLPRVATLKLKKKHPAKDKIMNELASINEKLEKMQKKYYGLPRVQYKSVNDCFTQSGHVEVIYENEKYPEEPKVSSDMVKCDTQNVSGDTVAHFKIQESLKKQNNPYSVFPNIEDTLREIETHLDNIVSLEPNSENIRKDSSTMSGLQFEDSLSNYWGGANLAAILTSLEKQNSSQNDTNRILKDLDQTRDKKLRAIKKQIEVVEEFCDRMSEIANDESDAESVSTAASTEDNRINQTVEFRNYVNPSMDIGNQEEKLQPISPEVADYIEGPDLQATIKKSNYLSKEFQNFKGYSSQPMVKVFSDNDQTALWRKRMRSMEQMGKTDPRSVESMTKLIDNLKFSLEHSVYELVA